MKFFQKSGQTSAKSDDGIAFLHSRNSDKVVDRAAYLEYVVENDLLDLLEARVSSTALTQFIEEHNDLPPGVTRTSEQTIQVRRS
jgi:hypothetical protein